MRILNLMATPLLIAGLSLLSCSEKIEPGNTAPQTTSAVAVPVVAVAHAVQPVMYDAVGTVKARVSATVSSKLMGVIQALR